jgi:LmbE family N-acetylglucosaminyl deacetylase
MLGRDRKRLRVLCLGAHSDDIEIGCAGTLLRCVQEFDSVEVNWAVLCARDERRDEARRSAQALLRRAARLDLVLGDLEDAHLPAQYKQAKAFVSDLGRRTRADVVFTHRLEDRHQDHRLVAELTWQTWRDHVIFEYEIPKYEGDLGRPNLFVPLPAVIAQRKVNHLMKHFASQHRKDWFSADTFLGMMRIRGLECRARHGLAEAFGARKLSI